MGFAGQMQEPAVFSHAEGAFPPRTYCGSLVLNLRLNLTQLSARELIAVCRKMVTLHSQRNTGTPEQRPCSGAKHCVESAVPVRSDLSSSRPSQSNGSGAGVVYIA